MLQDFGTVIAVVAPQPPSAAALALGYHIVEEPMLWAEARQTDHKNLGEIGILEEHMKCANCTAAQ